jgi:predicted DNA-binding ribbon-helix-helix protein
MVNDITLMESESTFYDSISTIAEKAKLLQQYSHLINFTSNTDTSINFMKSFYSLLQSMNEMNLKTTELFELICECHQCEYK